MLKISNFWILDCTMQSTKKNVLWNVQSEIEICIPNCII